MAKINVTEKDLSWYTRQGAGPLVVYLPGTSTWGPVDRPVLCDSIQSFIKEFGHAVNKPGLSLSYNMAQSFIKAGASVLFQRFIAESNSSVSSADVVENSLKVTSVYYGSYLNGYTVDITATETNSEDNSVVKASVRVNDTQGVVKERFNVNFVDPASDSYFLNEISEFVAFESDGFDKLILEEKGVTLTLAGGKDSENIEEVCDSIVKDSFGALKLLEDPYTYDFDVAIAAGFSKSTGEGIDLVDKAILDVVKSRGTSLFLVDGTSEMTYDEFYAYCEDYNFDTSYAAAVGPWGYAKLQNMGSTALLPGSYAHLIAWARSVAEGTPLWMAPAGVKRSSLGSFYVKPKYEVGRAILDQWQNAPDEVGSFRINPIMRAKSYGYVVYGNSTLLRSKGEAGQYSLLQTISARVTANLIKRRAFDISLMLQFDQIVGELYVQFKTLMGAYLDEMKYQGALYDYRIVVDEDSVTINSLNERTVPVTIQISPAPAAENFDITLEIAKSGVTFSDNTATN